MNDTPHITFVTHTGSLYGANRSLLALLRGLKAYPCTFDVVMPEEGMLGPVLRQEGVECTVLPVPWWFARQTGRIDRRLAYRMDEREAISLLAAHLRRKGTDIVHSNSSVTAVGMLAAQACGIPHVWHLRERVTQAYPLHPLISEEDMRALMRESDARIAISACVAGYWNPQTADDLHAAVIYNAVATEETMHRLRAARAAATPSDVFMFAVMGHMDAEKNHAEAIRAMADIVRAHPTAQMIVAGNLNTMVAHDLLQLIGQLDLTDHVRLTGYCFDPFVLLLRSDAFITCSRSEGYGRVVAESMAAGCCAIGYNAGGTVEQIDDGRNGLLYDGGPAGLAAIMSGCIRDRGRTRELGRRGWETVIGRNTQEQHTRAVWSIYEKMRAGRTVA